MERTYDMVQASLEPRIQMPAFLRSRARRPDSAMDARITRLNKYDRYLKLLRYNNDAWMKKRGKNNYSGFSAPQRQQLHGLFEALDTEGSGGLTPDELLEPLLALGLVQSKEELSGFLQRIGLSGPVADYEELQALLERAKGTDAPAVRRLTEVFLEPSYLPQKLRISCERRKTMLQAFTAHSQKSREKGQNVLRYFAEEISTTKPPVEKSEILRRKKLQRLSSLRRDSPNLSVCRGTSAATSRRSPDRPSDAFRREVSNLSSPYY